MEQVIGQLVGVACKPSVRGFAFRLISVKCVRWLGKSVDVFESEAARVIIVARREDVTGLLACAQEIGGHTEMQEWRGGERNGGWLGEGTKRSRARAMVVF